MALGMEVSLGPGHIVLNGEPAPLPKKGGTAPSQFSAHFYCGQTAGCMPLIMEVGLGPGHIVLDGDPAPAKKQETHLFCRFGDTIEVLRDSSVKLLFNYKVVSTCTSRLDGVVFGENVVQQNAQAVGCIPATQLIRHLP